MAELNVTIEGSELLVEVTIEVFGAYAPATREQPEEGPEVDPVSAVVVEVLSEGSPFKEGEEVLSLLSTREQLQLGWRAFAEEQERQRYDHCDC